MILQGLLTIVIALLSYPLVHNYPDTVSFLSPEEKTLLHDRLREDTDALSGETFKWHYARKAFEDMAVWLYCLCFVGCSLPLYTLSLFLVRTSYVLSTHIPNTDSTANYHRGPRLCRRNSSTAHGPPVLRGNRPDLLGCVWVTLHQPPGTFH